MPTIWRDETRTDLGNIEGYSEESQECLQTTRTIHLQGTRPCNDSLPIEEIDKGLVVIHEKQKRVAELYIDNQIDKKQHESYSSEYKLRNKNWGRINQATSNASTKKKSQTEKSPFETPTSKSRTSWIPFHTKKTQIIRFFIERVSLYARDNYAEVVFRFPQTTETKSVKLVSQQPTDFFPLILNIKTMSENERRVQILKSNPLMYIPKTLV